MPAKGVDAEQRKSWRKSGKQRLMKARRKKLQSDEKNGEEEVVGVIYECAREGPSAGLAADGIHRTERDRPEHSTRAER